LLEYIPYRKNDGTALRDSLRHPWFAARGYACVRIDLRGSGDSEGLLLDEYLPQEQVDGVDTIAWIAAQPWCDGNVGLFGKSWGGFNALQIAALRPPALKAIISIYSTDDRYADDVHYLGGAVLGSEMLSWATTMLAYNARPPDPATWGNAWREEWRKRLAHTPAYIYQWLSHQRRDAFWRQGSVCEDYDAITIPVLAVGGWADAYTNAVFRLVAGLRAPVKGLIGPWVHEYPEVAVPEPAIGFLQESLRWWDHWLKGRDTGVGADPDLRAWIQDACLPQVALAARPGTWASARREALGAGGGPRVLPIPAIAALPLALGHGAEAGVWCPYGVEGDLPGDQTVEDAQCACVDFPAAEHAESLLGFPELTVTVRCDQPQALLVVRLCALAPTGESQLVTAGVLNLAHRRSHAEPEPAPVGEPITVRVRLDAIGYRLLPGWRWRVALAGSWWPRAWPLPGTAEISVLGGDLSLPVHVARPEDADPRFEAPETAPLRAHTRLRERARDRRIARGPDGVIVSDWQDEGEVRLDPDGLTFGAISEDVYHIRRDDPLSAEARCARTATLGRGAWAVRIEAEAEMRADTHDFIVQHRLRAFEGESLVFDHAEQHRIGRDFA
jgi:hypothetical protein